MSDQAHLSQLFREIEIDLGTTALDILILKAFGTAIQNYKVQSFDMFAEQFEELFESLKHTEPRFAIVIDNFNRLHSFIKELHASCANVEELKEKIAAQIAALEAMHVENDVALRKFAINCVKNDDVILIHNRSQTVLNALKAAKDAGKKFLVLVAEQDIEKTHANIAFLHQHGIAFEVVPSYMLSHMGERVTKGFFGALTLKSNFDFVMDVGSSGVISELHMEKKPCYMFITTTKFSLWKSSAKQHEVHHVKESRMHKSKPISFDRLKFSHDRVPLSRFNFLITEKGVLDAVAAQKECTKVFAQVK